jgi:DNA-binding MarR family transcriptional regulator
MGMEAEAARELESSFLPAYALVRSILYSDYGRKNARYTKTQIAVLAALYWKKEMCMSELAELISVPREQMTRAVVPLVDDALAERYSDEINRKRVHVCLTDAGREYIRSYLHSRLDILREKLSAEESARLTEAVKTIVDILRDLRSRQ